MDKISNDIQYEKLYPYFYKDLRYMFNILKQSLDFYNKEKEDADIFALFEQHTGISPSSAAVFATHPRRCRLRDRRQAELDAQKTQEQIVQKEKEFEVDDFVYQENE